MHATVYFRFFQFSSQIYLKVVGGFSVFKIDPLRRAFQASHSVLDLELISPDCLDPTMEIRGDLLSRSAGYYLLLSMHSCTRVLLAGVKRLLVLLNLIQGSKIYWHPCRKHCTSCWGRYGYANTSLNI